MLKILPVILLLSTSAFANTLLLEKHAASGYVMPEHSFVKDCKIYKEGFMESTTIHGNGTATGFSAKIPAMRIQAMRLLLKVAQSGTVEESVMPCDIGTVIVKGHYGEKEVELESSIDCGAKRVNKSPAASVLTSMAGEICAF